MSRYPAFVFVCAVVSLSACVNATTRAPAKADSSSIRKAPPEQPPQGANTFKDLLRQVATNEDSARKCLLWQGDHGFHLGTSLSPATKTVPKLPTDLTAIVDAAPGRVRVLTRWGRMGLDRGGPVLVALTPAPVDVMRRPALAIFAASQGIYLRDVHDSFENLPTTPQTRDAVKSILAQASTAPITVFLTADADLSMESFTNILRAIPASAHVVLSAALPVGTTLPAEVQPAALRATHCDALPDPGPNEGPGELSAASLQSSFAAMRDLARDCMESSSAANFGRVTLAARITAGVVRNACLVVDEIQHATLATCLIEAAKSLHFESGAPDSYVDVHLPLHLEPVDEPAPTPICALP